MRDVHTIISHMHHLVNQVGTALDHDMHDLATAINRGDGLHPDDLPSAQLQLLLDASTLHRIAGNIEVWCRIIERDVKNYTTQETVHAQTPSVP